MPNWNPTANGRAYLTDVIAAAIDTQAKDNSVSLCLRVLCQLENRADRLLRELDQTRRQDTEIEHADHRDHEAAHRQA